MFVTNHALAGALIGQWVRRPAVATPVSFATHLAMDRIPHWGDGGDRSRFDRAAKVDGLLMLATLAALAGTAPRAQRWRVVASAAACVAPDLDKPMIRFAGRSPYPAALDQFHKRLQVGREFPRLLSRELAVGAALATAYAGTLIRARLDG